ncbi:MAG TPA: hypothetical protein VNO24_08640, partial [Blastocatellia bacterium]|nr:hypothetical protein [Blastocatellia bacterium]
MIKVLRSSLGYKRGSFYLSFKLTPDLGKVNATAIHTRLPFTRLPFIASRHGWLGALVRKRR